MCGDPVPSLIPEQSPGKASAVYGIPVCPVTMAADLMESGERPVFSASRVVPRTVDSSLRFASDLQVSGTFLSSERKVHHS